MKNLLIAISFFLVTCVQSQPGTYTNFSGENSLNFDGKRFLGVIDDVNGSTWFITSKGIYVLNNGNWSVINGQNHLIRDEISAYIVYENEIWIGTRGPIDFDGFAVVTLYKGGVSIYNINENKWRIVTKEEMGIKAPHVNKFFKDSNGDLWIALSPSPEKLPCGKLYPGGLIQYSKGNWIAHDSDIPKAHYRCVNNIMEIKDRLWFSTKWHYVDNPVNSGALFYFENNSFKTPIDPIKSKPITYEANSIFVDSKSNLWTCGTLCCKPKIFRWNGNEWHAYWKKSGLDFSFKEMSLSFFEIPNGRVGFLGFSGIHLYNDNNTWQSYLFENVNWRITKNRIRNLKINTHNKNKQFFYYNKNLCILENDNFKQYSMEVKTMEYDSINDVLWVYSEVGLQYLKDGNWNSLKSIQSVYDIIVDSRGTTWLFTAKQGVWAVYNEEVIHCATENKLLTHQVRMFYEDAEGAIWMGTAFDVCKFDYN